MIESHPLALGGVDAAHWGVRFEGIQSDRRVGVGVEVATLVAGDTVPIHGVAAAVDVVVRLEIRRLDHPRLVDAMGAGEHPVAGVSGLCRQGLSALAEPDNSDLHDFEACWSTEGDCE